MDQNNAVIADATIAAVLVKTGLSRMIKTDSAGQFKVHRLEPGSYSLRVSAAGFADQWKQDLVLVSGQNAQLEMTLYPQELSVTPVLVTIGEEAAIDITRTVVGGTITTHEIESLPINTRSRSISSSLSEALPRNRFPPANSPKIAAQIQQLDAEEAGIFAVGGGAAYSNNLTIDGLDNNDDRAARNAFSLRLKLWKKFR